MVVTQICTSSEESKSCALLSNLKTEYENTYVEWHAFRYAQIFYTFNIRSFYHLISSCWFVSYRIPSCFNVIRLPLRSTAISLGVNVTSSCKEQMNMFAIAKQRRTNKILIKLHNLGYLSSHMNKNLILKRLIGYNLQQWGNIYQTIWIIYLECFSFSP